MAWIKYYSKQNEDQVHNIEKKQATKDKEEAKKSK